MPKATEYHFQLPLPDETALRLFVQHAFGLRIPDVAVCPGHVSPWHAFASAYFARDRVMIWKASRGLGGKSLLLAMLGLTEALTLKCDVNVLGGSGEQSKRVHEYQTKAWNHPDAPRHLLASDPLKWETSFTWGNTIRALVASQSAVRGPHPQRLRLDEIETMEHGILDAALGQPMSKAGIPAQTVLSSTHHVPDGTFSYALKLAEEKRWPVAEWCYRENLEPHGWLTAEELEAKKTDVPSAMWQIEFELQAPSAEGRAIMPEAVSAMFQPHLGVFDGALDEYIEIEPPQRNAEYRHGADWARSRDFTVIATLRTDCAPARVVAFERTGRRPWPQMVERFEARIQRYGGTARHDGTGLGDVIDSYLSEPAEGVVLAGRTRSDLFSNYVNAIEKGCLVAPEIRFMRHEHQYATIADLYGSGHPPDSFVAMALAGGDLAVPITQPAYVAPAEIEQIQAEAEQAAGAASRIGTRWMSGRGSGARRRRYW